MLFYDILVLAAVALGHDINLRIISIFTIWSNTIKKENIAIRPLYSIILGIYLLINFIESFWTFGKFII